MHLILSPCLWRFVMLWKVSNVSGLLLAFYLMNMFLQATETHYSTVISCIATSACSTSCTMSPQEIVRSAVSSTSTWQNPWNPQGPATLQRGI